MEEMTRGRSQVIWRYLPGATFRYNESGAWCKVTEVTLRNPAPLTGALAEAVAQALRRWRAIGPAGYPDPAIQPGKYAVGEPFQVMYSVWPTVFTCRQCGRVHFYRELSRMKQVNDQLGCMTCKGRDQLRQVPYAYVCECGRLDTVYIQKHDNRHSIELVDKRSFQESYWFCKVCRTPLYRTPREGLGFRRCECAPKKAKRGVLLEDSRVYFSQTIDLVDIEPTALDRWKDNTRFSDLLLAAVLRVPAYSPKHLLDLAGWKPSSGSELSPELKATRDLLIQRGLPADEAESIVRQGAQQAGADPWVSYEAGLNDLRELVPAYAWKDSRRTVEYVFVRDDPSVAAIPLDDLIGEATQRGDSDSAARLQSEKEIARQLGLVDLRVVQALPVLLAGIGYSRYFATPRDAESADEPNVRQVALRPYVEQDGKVPVYAARNTTEAFLFNLDPYRLTAFLQANLGVRAPDEASRSVASLRAWLLGQVGRLIEAGESHLLLRAFEQEIGMTVDEPSALAFGVLHTIAHVLKATAHKYVGIDADSLAEYLFPSHSAGLLYVSSHVEFTLGGIDSVFRANLTQWLGSARDYAGRCCFDPVCARAGGACSACLYPKFGCGYFNRTLSRTFLFGGYVPGRPQPLEGYWSSNVVAASEKLRAQIEAGT